MKIIGKFRGIAGDLIYSILGLVAMNGVIQLILYPYLNKIMGADKFGDALTLLSLVGIMGSTFGTAANYSRMVSFSKKQDSNGDYNLFLAMIAGLSVFVSVGGAFWLGNTDILFIASFFMLMVVTVIRYYADVEFRIVLNYRRFFIYYLLISIGYIIGVIIFPVTQSWTLAMLTGEVAAVIFVIFKGHIFKGKVFEKSEFFSSNMKSVMLLSGTELIAAVILNADRLLLQIFAGGLSVTVFYAATLIGKMVSLISMPLNGVIMGHLSRYKGKLPSKIFIRLCGVSLILSVVLNFMCMGVSYIFVKIMYPDIFELVRPYFFIANAGQILFFISNTLTVILLRFTHEKYQLYINIIYLIMFAVIAVPMAYKWELWGMAWALLIVNFLKIVVVAVVGKLKLKE